MTERQDDVGPRTETVDLVICGDAAGAYTAAVSALQKGQRVLVVLRSDEERVARRLRRHLRAAAGVAAERLTIKRGAEVVCADGVRGVEAVVLRHAKTGRLSAVNASAFLSFDACPPEDWR